MPGSTANINEQLFLNGGGEMGKLIRDFDWDSSTIGNPEQWPAILKHFTTLALASPSPMLICWGESYTQIYNDAFRPILGTGKHPQALGIGASQTYAEAWPAIEPLFMKVMAGEVVSNPEFKLTLNRENYPEELYFNFSYNPIKDEAGFIHGILVICIETTSQVKANKQLDETQKKPA